jgi:hypothetical protein
MGRYGLCSSEGLVDASDVAPVFLISTFPYFPDDTAQASLGFDTYIYRRIEVYYFAMYQIPDLCTTPVLIPLPTKPFTDILPRLQISL